MECLDAITANAIRGMGVMSSKTEMERKAISDARRQFYAALMSIERAEPFDSATKDEMESVIEAVWDGLRASMQWQAAGGDVPF